MIDRKGRRQRRRVEYRIPKLGYYIIITDAKKTEKNYFEGLKRSIPKHLQGMLVIKTIRTDIENFVDVALEEQNKNPNYAETWIVFDRDQVPNFDQIIKYAENKEIKVGWSNPCIEIWFYAYFGKMEKFASSKHCCHEFNKLFKKVFNHEYNKADPLIFEKLNKRGNINLAIRIATKKYKEYIKDEPHIQPSSMFSCTTIYRIIEEIINKMEIQ